MNRALSLIAILALAACSGGGAQLSLSGRAGSTAAAAPAALTLSNGITVDHVRIALREVELERASATPNDVADLQEFETGPLVVDLSGAALNGTVQQVTVQDVPAGAYREIKFKVHPPAMSDSTDPAVVAMATVQAGGASIIVEGQIDGQPYTFLSALDADEKFEGTFNFSSGPQNLTFNVDPSGWFGGTGAARLDPRSVSNKSAIENNIQASMKVFEDNDHNGVDDSTQH
ncbi:MAG TPA: hypothetical protein VKB92_10865 [Myxococcales bacterium]|nr:hypothetical protein [Myxococcales bacterium]